MEFGTKISLFVLFLFAFSGEKSVINAQKCGFPAIFNFGDSNSDTGAAYTLFPGAVAWPDGITLGKVSKRMSDGLLIIDYLAESLGLPYLKPYLNASMDKEGTFKYGANFAVSGQRINPDPDQFKPHNWDWPLNEQVTRFLAFKSSALASKERKSANIYPKPESFSEALYTFDIGQNDVNSIFGFKPVPTILEYFTNEVKRLLDDGAKYLWIHNTGPFGCLSNMVKWCPFIPKQTCTYDKNGCIVEFNGRAQEFNSQLKLSVDGLRKQYPNAVIALVDMFSAKYSLFSNDSGFDNELKFKKCCGNDVVGCGASATVNGTTVFGDTEGRDPSKYISWDGVHYTQAANSKIANLIFGGAFSEPLVTLSNAC